MKKRYIILAAAIFGFTAAAFAQSIPVPQVPIINPNDLLMVVPNGVPSAQSKYATPAQITSQQGYAKFSPATGFQYTFGNSQSIIILTHASTVAAGSVTFASAPSDGAQECVYAQNIVTAFQLVPASGQTIDNAVTALTAAAKVCYTFSISNATWDRS